MNKKIANAIRIGVHSRGHLKFMKILKCFLDKCQIFQVEYVFPTTKQQLLLRTQFFYFTSEPARLWAFNTKVKTLESNHLVN